MTRIVAGEAGGRRLAVPPRTRPTSERVREALFSTVASMPVTLPGHGVLDLYAGSGALGLEALSRGAAWCVLVESDPRAVAVLTANCEAVGLPGALVRRADVAAFLRGPAPPEPAVLVLADPPYEVPTARVARMLEALAVSGWLAEDGVAVLERPTREAGPAWPPTLRVVDHRRYGDTTLWYFRHVRAEPPSAPSPT